MHTIRFILCYCLFTFLSPARGLTPQYAAIVIEASTGNVLEQENADAIRHPASLTKMMTLYMVFDALRAGKVRMATQVPVSAHAARQIPSKLGLRPGEHVAVETIIKGLVTKSANDAAAAIAEYLGGSEASFAALMTRKARSLGMHHTIFKNASGVPNPFQVTTARDMAILSRALYLHFPQDYRHFRLQAFHHRGKVHRNHNHLLGKVPGLDGIKTGWVAASGFNLAASAVRKGADNKPKRLIAVVLGGPNRHWRDRRIVELLETNFQRSGMDQELTLMDGEDEEDSEVALFLNEEKAKEAAARSPPEPVPVSWPLPPLAPEPAGKPIRHGFKKPVLSRASGKAEKNVWGVQIGSYKSLREAKINAQKALTLLRAGEISTPRVTKGKKAAYGARLLNLTRTEAENICKKQPSKKGCRILAAG